MHDFSERLSRRAALSGLVVPAALLAPLTTYVDLLEHWNEKINLTSLVDPDEAIDRLVLEPIAAATYLPTKEPLIDLGSGGGSPAIPLALALSATRLVMVESRERKAAFLREAVRQLQLDGIATVETARFEELAGREHIRESFGIVSIRAVRMDGPALSAAFAFLRPHGLVASFRAQKSTDRAVIPPSQLAAIKTVSLLKQSPARLSLLRRVG